MAEPWDTANKINETIRESLIERHVAATIAAALVRPSDTPQDAVNKYREVLRALG